MTKTVTEWYNIIIGKVNTDPDLASLNSTSAVADYKLWAYIVAYVAWTLDAIFGLHLIDVLDRLAQLKPHTLNWYRNLALNFQYGQGLNSESGIYDNAGLNAAQIAAQKIISQSAVVENRTDGTLRIKVVKGTGNEYAQLNEAELAAFAAYIFDSKDAGVRINVSSLPPDDLKVSLDVFYDPLVLDNTGRRIDGTSATPVMDAVNAYLKNLKFNGEFAKTRLTDTIQQVDGVELVGLKSAQSRYGTQPFAEIDERIIPDAGYLRVIDGGFTINYRQYV